MFEHFTGGAHRVLVPAIVEALDLYDRSFRPERVFLGMMRASEGVPTSNAHEADFLAHSKQVRPAGSAPRRSAEIWE
jgi:hypothetical protein